SSATPWKGNFSKEVLTMLENIVPVKFERSSRIAPVDIAKVVVEAYKDQFACDRKDWWGYDAEERIWKPLDDNPFLKILMNDFAKWLEDVAQTTGGSAAIFWSLVLRTVKTQYGAI